MFYAIDNDQLDVESVSIKGEDLASYIVNNDLTLALSLITEEDDLSLNFTVEELTSIYNNLETNNNLDHTKDKEFESEEDAARACWDSLEEYQNEFKKFTVALGKKMLKSANSKSAEDNLAKPDAKVANKPKSAPNPRIKLNNDDILVVVNGKCKKGSILDTIVNAIDEEMLETVGEVLEYITTNHIIPKTGELADMKFAEHNIKYFLKEGKISTEIV